MTSIAIALQKRARKAMSRSAYLMLKRSFFAASLLLMLSSAFYMVFIGRAITLAMGEQSILTETKLISSKVADLEASYLLAQKQINLEQAQALGFQVPKSAEVLAIEGLNSKNLKLSLAHGN